MHYVQLHSLGVKGLGFSFLGSSFKFLVSSF
jgi:hypothetical protein